MTLLSLRSRRDHVVVRPSRRTVGAGLLAVALVFSLSSCSDEVGDAATVAGVSITESGVLDSSAALATTAAQATEGSTAPSTGDRQALNRRVLTDRIRHQLLADAAGRIGVTADEAQVATVLASGTPELATLLNVSEAEVPQAVRDTLTVIALAAQQGTTVTDVSVTASLARYDTRDAAVAAREKVLADPSTFEAQSQTTSLLGDPSAAPYGLYSAPDGSVVVLEINGSWALARITDRTVTQSDQLGAALQNVQQSAQQDPAGAQARVFQLSWLSLQRFVQDVPVQVNPRFGVWDPVSLQVVPSHSGL